MVISEKWDRPSIARPQQGVCYKLNVLHPQIPYVEILISIVTVFGREALDHASGYLHEWDLCPYKGNTRDPQPFPPYEDTVRKWPFMNQEVDSHQTFNLLTP